MNGFLFVLEGEHRGSLWLHHWKTIDQGYCCNKKSIFVTKVQINKWIDKCILKYVCNLYLLVGLSRRTHCNPAKDGSRSILGVRHLWRLPHDLLWFYLIFWNNAKYVNKKRRMTCVCVFWRKAQLSELQSAAVYTLNTCILNNL